MSSSSKNGSSGTSRRSRAANKIITFAGLSGNKANSSSGQSNISTFPSFRFSPESDEIHEVLSHSVNSLPEETNSTVLLETNDDLVVPQSESVPSSPKPGETSPIKEYIRKNWANKWDKKSLSLDLDLRGKIKTVIEDKRKSLVSHFIAEETGLVVPAAPGITEHTGEAVSSSSSVSSQSENRGFSFDNSTQKISSHIIPTNTTIPVKMEKQKHEVNYEEMGIDFMASIEEENILEEVLTNDQVDLMYLNWVYPPAACAEKFEGVVSNIEPRPENIGIPNTPDLFPPISVLVQNFCIEVCRHSLMKYVVGLLAGAILLPLYSVLTAFITFICGILITLVVLNTISSNQLFSNYSKSTVESIRDISKEPESSQEEPTENVFLTLKMSPKTQGWLLQFDGYYNPQYVTFLQTDPVFARLESSKLYISLPSPKYRIPKRKLWNDPEFNHDIKFIRHTVFDLSGAQIFIAPERLASRRVWNKKYPIGVRLASSSNFWHVNPVPGSSTLSSPVSESNSGIETSNSRGGTQIPSNCSPIKSMRRYSVAGSLIKGDKELIWKPSDGKVFYLYTRTCREKEDWFRRLVNAAKLGTKEDGDGPKTDLLEDHLRYMRNIIPNFEACLQEGGDGGGGLLITRDTKMKSSSSVESEDSVTVSGGSPTRHPTPPDELLDLERVLTTTQSPFYLNALLGRLLYDAVRSSYWSLQLQNVIQRKLNFVKRPPFVELLIVKDLDLGGSFPIIQRASEPIIDSRGLWVDLDVTYEGNFCLTLETKINLLKLRRSPTNEDEPPPPNLSEDEPGLGRDDEDSSLGNNEILIGNMYDSNAEDSGESSEDDMDSEDFYLKYEDDEMTSRLELSNSTNSLTSSSTVVQSSKKAKLLKMVEKVATSNFVSEMKMVKSAIDKVANTPLLLTVEVKQASGTIAANIPHPPSNRVWMGFRTKPQLKLITTPKVGERSVNLTPLTDWIQKKIQEQIQRVLVLPNMDDLTIGIMEFQLPS